MISKVDPTYINMISKKDVKPNKNSEDEELMKAAEDFESIYLKMMMDSMDKTVQREESFLHGGNAEEIFRGMLNQQRAEDISKTGSFGLAKIIYEQLSIKQGNKNE